jgi:NADPH:quinone reductase-like Zn-dependent oxidoreductase
MGTDGDQTMRAVRLGRSGGPEALTLERIAVPETRPGEALVRVHAAAITRDELDWVEDRFPATPSYELSGVIESVSSGDAGVRVGDAMMALTAFDRDGVAADVAAVPAELLAPKPTTLDHVQAAAVPMAALSAWQGLLVHSKLQADDRVVIHGAGGGVGHVAVQLAVHQGAHVIGTTSSEEGADVARSAGAHELLVGAEIFDRGIEPVDVVFDTVGGNMLARSPELLVDGGRLVTIAEEPPEGVDAVYFVVEPDGEQLAEISRLVDAGTLRPAVDSTYPLASFREAFDRTMTSGKRGKVVLRVVE